MVLGIFLAPPGFGEAESVYLPTALYFEHLGSREGLSQGSVSAVLRDRRGFLWIGTIDGLNRYDGQEVRRYGVPRAPSEAILESADPNVSDILPHTFITALDQDSDGSLWIGTQGGLVHFVPESGAFRWYLPNREDPHSLGGAHVFDFLRDRRDRLWIAHVAGLDRWQSEDGRFLHHRHVADDRHTLGDRTVVVLAEDVDGDLWLGTKVGLHRMDPDSGRVDRQPFAGVDSKGLTRQPIHAGVFRIGQKCLDPIGVEWIVIAHQNDRGLIVASAECAHHLECFAQGLTSVEGAPSRRLDRRAVGHGVGKGDAKLDNIGAGGGEFF